MERIQIRNGATLRSRLELDRLERRIVRVESVLAALRVRMREHQRHSRPTPLPLRCAIGDFEHDLATMRLRVDELVRDVPRAA
jgi:hypothetical protein